MLINAQEYFVGCDDLVEKHLVLAATSKANDASEILDHFDQLGIDKIILTKLDETSSLGAFVELAEKWHKPFSFFTNGQKVPDDYQDADKKLLAEKVLEKWLDDDVYAEDSKKHGEIYDLSPEEAQKTKIFVKNITNYDDNT